MVSVLHRTISKLLIGLFLVFCCGSPAILSKRAFFAPWPIVFGHCDIHDNARLAMLSWSLHEAGWVLSPPFDFFYCCLVDNVGEVTVCSSFTAGRFLSNLASNERVLIPYLIIIYIQSYSPH